MIKTLVVAAALTVGLAGDAVTQQAPPAPPAHHLPPHHPLRRLPPRHPHRHHPLRPDCSGTDAVAIGPTRPRRELQRHDHFARAEG
jgi:hypothetical protein